MGLADLVRASVGLADRLTKDLQPAVTHEAWVSHDADGKPTFAAGVTRHGVLSYETRSFRDVDGHERVSTAQITFAADVRVDVRDRFTLPDGTQPPIARLTGPADPGTPGAVFVRGVWFGEGQR